MLLQQCRLLLADFFVLFSELINGHTVSPGAIKQAQRYGFHKGVQFGNLRNLPPDFVPMEFGCLLGIQPSFIDLIQHLTANISLVCHRLYVLSFTAFHGCLKKSRRVV
jgi:hypothetical protein